MNPSDIVMDRTDFQSNKSKDKVAKLHIKATCRGRYIVRKLNRPDSPDLKYLSHILYILPPLKPYKPVDSSDTRYLNQSHTTIVNPFKEAISIELYNKKWLNKPPATSSPPFIHDHDTLSFPSEAISFSHLSQTL